MDGKTTRPEHYLVRRALGLGALATPAAFAAGALAGGAGTGLSAALGVLVVVLNFAAHGLSLAWAAGVSLQLLHGVAVGGFVARMGIIVGAMFALDQAAFFSPVIFGAAAVAGTFSLLVYEARLVGSGVGGELQLPAAGRGRAGRLAEPGAR